MSFILNSVSECNIIQAAEWMLYQWLPLSQKDEKYHIQGRKRIKDPKESIDYQQKAVILLAALQSEALFLYDRNGRRITLETKNDAAVSLRDYIREHTGDEPMCQFNVLEEIMSNWYNGESLFFHFTELKREFPKKSGQITISNKVQIKYEDDCMFLYTGNKKILIKKFNDGEIKNIIKTLIEHPYQNFGMDDLINLTEKIIRVDNKIWKVKNEANKNIEKATNLEDSEKKRLKSIIDKSFVYEKNKFVFNPPSEQ